MLVFILGTAGSGKTTFSKAFCKYLEDSCLINLDPGSEVDSDVSIREFVKAEDVMKKYKLGPNSAIIRSVELSLNYIEDLKERIPNRYWKIVDTPGQLELFLYRDCGKKIIESLKEIDSEVAIIFLVDSQDVLSPENFVTILAWNVIISLKLETEALTVINKKDLLKNLEEVRSKIVSGDFLKELKNRDALSEMIAEGFSEFYEYTSIRKRPIFISAKYDSDFYEVQTALKELFCSCGEL